MYPHCRQDLKGEIAKVARFLGKTLTNEQLTQLTNHLHIDQFAKNKAVNYEMCKEFTFMNSSGKFIRKGNMCKALSSLFGSLGLSVAMVGLLFGTRLTDVGVIKFSCKPLVRTSKPFDLY